MDNFKGHGEGDDLEWSELERARVKQLIYQIEYDELKGLSSARLFLTMSLIKYLLSNHLPISSKMSIYLLNRENYVNEKDFRLAKEDLLRNLRQLAQISGKMALDLVDNILIRDEAEQQELWENLNQFYWINNKAVDLINGSTYLSKARGNIIGLNKQQFSLQSNSALAFFKRGLQNRIEATDWPDPEIKQFEGDQRPTKEEFIADLNESKLSFERELMNKAIDMGIVKNNQFLAGLIKTQGLFEQMDQRKQIVHLLNNGYGQWVLENHQFFNELSLHDLFVFLMELEKYFLIKQNIALFKEFFAPQAIPDLAKLGYLDFYLDNRDEIDRYYPISDKELEGILGPERLYLFAYRLPKFEDGLSDDLFYQLIEKGYASSAVKNLEVFDCLDLEKIKTILVAKGKMGVLARYPEKFIKLSNKQESMQSWADFLLANNGAKALAEHLDKYEGLHEKTFTALLEAGFALQIAFNLKSFARLDEQSAQAMANKGAMRLINGRRDYFEDTDWEKLLADPRQLLATGNGEQVVKTYEKYPQLSKQELLETLLKTNQCYWIAIKPDFFTEVASFQELAELLMEHGAIDYLASALRKYRQLNSKIFRLLMAREDKQSKVLRNLVSFENLDKIDAIFMLEKGFYTELWNNLSSFVFTRMEILVWLMENGKTDLVLKNLDGKMFPGITEWHNDIAKWLLIKEARLLLNNLHVFQGLDKDLLAGLSRMSMKVVAYNLTCFGRIDKQYAKELINWGFENQVRNHLKLFVDYSLVEYERDLIKATALQYSNLKGGKPNGKFGKK